MSAVQSPVMSQYQKIKSQYQDAILFFRLGDFYEMFYEDAQIAARELEIALTSRNKGSDDPIPLAGIPHQTYQVHAAKLLKRGYKIAICEQTSDPKMSKGIVERQVVRVLTPGTVTEDNLLSGTDHNYLLSVSSQKDRWALAYLDLSTGDAHLTGAIGGDAKEKILEEIIRLRPSEVVLSQDLETASWLPRMQQAIEFPGEAISRLPSAPLESVDLPQALGDLTLLRDEPEKAEALRLLVSYVRDTLGSAFSHFSRLHSYVLEECLVLDPGSIRNLDLFENSRDRKKRGSLFWVLDRTKTAMGSRLLKSWMQAPLIHPEEIEKRLDCVDALVKTPSARSEIAKTLSQVHDIPRILAKISAGIAHGRDLVQLGHSLEVFPQLESLAAEAGLPEGFRKLGDFEALAAEIVGQLVDAPPLTITEGGLFREGVSEQLDELRAIDADAKGFVDRLEEQERDRTGIRSLKIKFNKVFGYFIEITKPNLRNVTVPSDYQRKQTMTNVERFVTPMLKEKEVEILQAEERARGLEHEMFVDLRQRAKDALMALKAASDRISQLDTLTSLATVAFEWGYVRPRFRIGSSLRIQGGRHPVVERMITAGDFVPNDLLMSPDQSHVIILTGPNMAGKSTFLRQAALLVLMAQMGSFVPAESMELGIVDRIFTRVGASDDLASGQSTFMVEMQETGYILEHATPQSLVILDEVGRGTSTYDGLSLAWAIAEHLYRSPSLRPKTLFATHYHELTELANLYPGVTNLSTKVLEQGDKVIFLHRVVDGYADKSYGIHVAKLAGLPPAVLDRARELLFELEKDEARDVEKKKKQLKRARAPGNEAEQLLLFDPAVHPILDEIRNMDVNAMTPLEALTALSRLKARL